MSEAAATREEALAAVTVIGTDEKPRRLGDFWAERAALVLFVRHFG
jgi:hypothetical protein